MTAFEWNTVANTIAHTTNATNEITTLTKANAGGGAKVVSDDFATSIASLWSQPLGGWSISSGQVNVDSLDGTAGLAVLSAGTTLDNGALEAKITFPSGSSNEQAGVIFSDDGRPHIELTRNVFILPLWCPTLVALLLATGLILYKHPRHERGACHHCGYDLRGSPCNCPECNSPRPTKLKP